MNKTVKKIPYIDIADFVLDRPFPIYLMTFKTVGKKWISRVTKIRK